MPDFDRTIFKDEFVAAGLWIAIRVTSQDTPPVVVDTHAYYSRPGTMRVGSSASNEHEIKYVHDDLPDLVERDGIEFLDDDGNAIAGEAYRVRQDPFVSEAPSDDQSGYFRRALLTKLAP